MDAGPIPELLVVTPCRDDGWALDSLAESLAAQTLPPKTWVVVDDASTDDTPARLAALVATIPFLVPVRRERPQGRRIGQKAVAVMAGYATVAPSTYDYVAVVDADVTLPDHYFATIHEAMEEDASLGVTGGRYVEADGRRRRLGRSAGTHVPGPAQVFRAEVFDAVGGYTPLPYGGLDVHPVTRARMLGWATHVLPHLQYEHRRRMGTGGHGSPLKADRNLGRQDYDLGTAPTFEVVKLLRHVTRRPMVLAAVARAMGYFELALRRSPRSVDADYVRFVRGEQRARLRAMARR